jgi:small conductance mechanosensitive channel
MDTLDWLASPSGTLLIEKLITISLILVIAVIVWEGVSLAIERYLQRLDGTSGVSSARARTLLPLFKTTMMVLISVLVTLIVLSELGVNIGPLLAGAGVIGLAVGFGSQKLVQDVITGLFMLVEDTLAVGDVVKFDADHSGVVESISVRSVRLRDLAGNVHTLPFSEVKTTLNMTKDWSFYVFEVGIAYREDVDRVMGILGEIGEDMQKDDEFGSLIAEPLEMLGLDKFGDSAIVIKARIKVRPPIKQWTVGREFNRRMKIRFDAEGIEIPFPHQTLYFGVDQAGKAPPAYVALLEDAAAAEEAASSPGPQGGTEADIGAENAARRARGRQGGSEGQEGGGDH